MKRNLTLMLCISFLQSFVFYGPIATLYRQSRGIGINEIFIIEAIFLVTVLLFEIPWGVLADKIGYKKTLAAANLVFLLSKLVFFISDSFLMFSLERVLLAIAVSGLSGCDSALIYESLGQRNAQKFFGRYYSLGALGFVAASVTGSWMAAYSYDLTVILTIFFYLLAAILTLFLTEPVHEQKEAEGFIRRFRECLVVLKAKRFLVYIAILSGILGVIGQAMVFLNQLQFHRAGINVVHFGMIIAALELMRMAASKTHILTQRLGERFVLVGATLAVGVFYLILSYTDSPFPTIAAMAVILSCLAILQPLIQDILNRSIRSNRATLLSIFSWMGSVMGILLNPIVGHLSDVSVRMVFASLGILAVFTAIGFFIPKLSEN